ncbi:5-methyltetrahydropteroyltriglutamate--homocysteine S-methyltransferase [Ligilactobacillus hayakitensis]|nr:5-methyltetrahydropteroyltriglutamate--homocysteine S-methyltransferase [Ligilactobacillus hayakitensis]
MVKFNDENIHFDIVGSFLRPEALKEAREQFENGRLDAKSLERIEDQEITKLVAQQKAAGLKFVSDGEFRRAYWHLDTFWGFDGIDHVQADNGYFFHGEETKADAAALNGKISFSGNHPDVAAFKFLYQLTKDDPTILARQSIPAPAQLYLELFRDEKYTENTRKYYPNNQELIYDIVSAYRGLIEALYQAGCRDLKLDDCTWGVIVDDDAWQVVAKEGNLSRQEVQELYLELNNRVLADWPADLRLSTHICRGNYHSTWAAKGGYGVVADAVFLKENVDAFYLEFDDERSGGFEPLAKVPTTKEVVLGIVTSKNPKLETKAELKARLKEASRYVPKENLVLSTQCGFASTEEGNKLTFEQQWDKIKLVIQTAKEFWQE